MAAQNTVPEMISVKSSNINAAGYDQQNREIIINYKNGTSYSYKGVPQHIYQELMQSSSIGKYLHSNIKKTFPCAREKDWIAK